MPLASGLLWTDELQVIVVSTGTSINFQVTSVLNASGILAVTVILALAETSPSVPLPSIVKDWAPLKPGYAAVLLILSPITTEVLANFLVLTVFTASLLLTAKLAVKYANVVPITAVNNVATAMDTFDYAKKLFSGSGSEDNSQNVRKYKYNDYTAEAIIDKSENISSKDKETVKEMIEHDSVNNYEINVTAGASGEDIARQLVQAIKNIQNNR